jgi:hypothetical protein
MERVTAGDATDSLPSPADCAIFLDGSNEVIAASWIKTTVSSDERTQSPLIATRSDDQNVRGQIPQLLEDALHCV